MERTESALGLELPESVRRLYREVADGGFGPGNGLLPLAGVAAAVSNLRSGDELPRGRVWPPALVPLVALDPGWVCVDARNGSVVEWNPEGLAERSNEATFAASFRERFSTVEAWLSDWLRSPTLAEEAAKAGANLVTLRYGQVEVDALVGPSAPGAEPPQGRPKGAVRSSRAAVGTNGDSRLVPDSRAIARYRTKVAARIEADAANATLLAEAHAVPADALSPAARERLADGLTRVSAHRLAWHVPRKSTGAPDLGSGLALIRLGDPDRRPGTREPWLVARGRVDTHTITFMLAVEELISENEVHRWDLEPWRWAGDDHTRLIHRWATTVEDARRSIAALEHGQWEAAFGSYGVALDASVAALLAGRDAERSLADLTATWAPRLSANLARVAPWRLATATGELRRGRAMRLFGLGGVTQQRKPGIFLSGDADGPRLSLEWSASNERVREPAWTRPIDLDLVVAGLISVSSVPT